MLESRRSICICCKRSYFLQEVFDHVLILIFIQEEFCPQTMKLLLFESNHLVDYLNDWIVKPERVWISITAQILWNMNLT